ncbi:MAG: VTT domain-containing protein [Firmicutes bacterium]|nr:VTT domain-containing protein [Bacillota bacterium]
MDKRLKKEKKRRIFKKVSAVVKLVLLIIILIGIPVYVNFFQHDLIERFSNLREIEMTLMEYRAESVLLYLTAQIIQIVICIIPGQELQFAAGYMYGFWLGYLLSLVGAALGSVITYYLAKILGHDAMHMFFGEEKINETLEKIQGKKGIAAIFLIYLIPGVPKDLCNYVAGLSEIRLSRFLIVSLIGRSPGMMGSLLIGNQLMNGQYTSAVIIGVVAIVLCLLGIIFRKKVMDVFDKLYDKLMKI